MAARPEVLPRRATVFSTSDPFFSGAMPIGTVLQTWHPQSLARYVNSASINAISIRWQSTDTEIMRLMKRQISTCLMNWKQQWPC